MWLPWNVNSLLMNKLFPLTGGMCADATRRSDGQTIHKLNVKDVPVDGFWSIDPSSRRSSGAHGELGSDASTSSLMAAIDKYPPEFGYGKSGIAFLISAFELCQIYLLATLLFVRHRFFTFRCLGWQSTIDCGFAPVTYN